MTVSHSNVSISPGMGTGRRRPEASGGPSSIFWQTRAFTPPLSSVTISVGPRSQWNVMPSSSAWRSSSTRAGASAFVRR